MTFGVLKHVLSPSTEMFVFGTEKKGTNQSTCHCCLIGPFSINPLAMGLLVGPFFLLFALVTGYSTGHGACTSRRAATLLRGSQRVVFTVPRLQSLTVADSRRFSVHLQGTVFTIFMEDDDEYAKYGFEPAAKSDPAVLESSTTTASYSEYFLGRE